MLYFDSNYILKCYLPEPNANLVRALASRPVAKSCSIVGRVEVLAALHRKLRERSLTRAQLRAVWGELRKDEEAGVWSWLPFDRAVERAVEDALLGLDARVFLRAADAIHLVTARLHGFAAVHSHDRRLLAAAAKLGVRGVDVLPRKERIS